jgi:penicillin-binding protein 2
VLFDRAPVVFNTLDAPQEYLDAIKQGMKDVVETGGTAEKYFRDYKYKNDMGGKTGTAEVSLIDLENNSWFVCFAPYENPEIAVVVYTPHGYSGGLSSLVAQDIITYYIDDSKLVAKQTIPLTNALVPENNLLVPLNDVGGDTQ